MFLPEIFNLGKAFRQYFEIVPAYSDALKDEVFRIRHQVYCEELAFEPQRPDRRETDDYDAQSLHLLIRSMQTGEIIGCFGLTEPDFGSNPSPRCHDSQLWLGFADVKMTKKTAPIRLRMQILGRRNSHDFPTFRLVYISARSSLHGLTE